MLGLGVGCSCVAQWNRSFTARSRWWLDGAVVACAVCGELERARLVTRLAVRGRGRFVITVEVLSSDILDLASNRLY